MGAHSDTPQDLKGPEIQTAEASSPISGAQVLDEARNFLTRFAVFPSESAEVACTLWAAHTHAYQALNVTPRLALLSDEPASGKTRVLDLLSTVCARAEQVVDPTGPVMFALIQAEHPTILLDETDQLWGRAGSYAAKREVAAVLNVGYRQGAKVLRSRSDMPKAFDCFAPVAFAGLGTLPDTLMTRSVVVRMRRRRKDEAVSAYMPRLHAPLGMQVGQALSDWAKVVMADLASAWPELPEGVEDRTAELWESLLSVADVAGGDWPDMARQACREMVLSERDETDVMPPAQRLIRDLATVWPAGKDRAPTADLVRALIQLQPWSHMWNEATAPREMAALLRPHGLSPVPIRLGKRVVQGYKRESLPLHVGQDNALTSDVVA